MRKIRFIFEEFLRSFQKSLFKNILLMSMFAISLVMSVIMCSYYLDLGAQYSSIERQLGNSTWCRMAMGIEGFGTFQKSIATIDGCNNLMNYYDTLHSSETYPIYSIETRQSLYMREADVKSFFGERSYDEFLDSEQKESIISTFGDETCSVLSLNSAQMDWKAYQLMGLRTVEGEGFTKQNLALEQASDPIPVLLGYNYKDIIPIGATMEIELWFHTYSCKVVGILEKGTKLTGTGDPKGELYPIDSYIVFPYGIKVLNTSSKLEVMQRLAFNNLVALEYSAVRAEVSDYKKQIYTFKEIGEKYSLPALYIDGTPMGLELLRNESKTSVQIMLILTIALFCFTVYGLFITFYDKIQSNKRVYGIYLMNGCTTGMILFPCLLEIAVILLPTILVCKGLFTYDNIGVFDFAPILRVVSGLVGVVFVAGSVFVVTLMRGVDTEQLIRQKE